MELVNPVPSVKGHGKILSGSGVLKGLLEFIAHLTMVIGLTMALAICHF